MGKGAGVACASCFVLGKEQEEKEGRELSKHLSFNAHTEVQSQNSLYKLKYIYFTFINRGASPAFSHWREPNYYSM